MNETPTASPANAPSQVLIASLIGTTIEFFDFYIYATAAVLVFPRLFFPARDPSIAGLLVPRHLRRRLPRPAHRLRPLRPLRRPHRPQGHPGRRAPPPWACPPSASDSLPTYHSIGFAAPFLLSLCRFGQGIGLGGEWGGAVLLAIENAPPGKRAWYGMFPQLGAPLGFFLSGGVFLLLSQSLTDAQFFAYGWRLPFLASSILVLLGLYVRLTITRLPPSAKSSPRALRSRCPCSPSSATTRARLSPEFSSALPPSSSSTS